MISCDKHRGRLNDFSLLAMIDGLARRHVRRGRAISYFDKGQAATVQHDQVDLTATAMEISCDGTEILFSQVIERELFRLTTYSCSALESHGASSVASGAIKVPSSPMSCIGPPMSSCSGSATTSPR